MKQTFQAVLYSAERPFYHGMELPPGGLSEAEIPADINTRKETLYGKLVGAYGSECIFPKGYENFQILEVSSFMPFEAVNQWVKDTSKQLRLPMQPTELSDLCVDQAA